MMRKILGLLALISFCYAKEGETCNLCQVAVQDLEGKLESNATQSEIIHDLEKICEILPAKSRPECDAAIEQLLPQFNESLDSIVTKYSPFAVCSMLSLCQIDCCATPFLPEQIHLSLGSKASSMVVMWTTLQATEQPVVLYGEDKDNLTQRAFASKNSSNYGSWRGTLYTAEMTGLKASTTYYYMVGDATVAPDYWMKPAWSQPHHLKFKTQGPVGPSQGFRFASIGDAGATDVSMMTYMRLTERVAVGDLDLVLHDGDIGYADGYQAIWDEFLRKMESVGGFVPVMTSPGNHEGFFNFHTYKARFTMPFEASGSDDPLFYSFDYANAHVVSLNSEGFMGLEANKVDETSPMYKFLQKDLASVDRTITPWVIVMLHRPLYCTGKSRDSKVGATILREGLEQLFYEHKVDVVFQAHVHNYQTTWPVFNQTVTKTSFDHPDAPVYIVNGAAGNKEHGDGVKTGPTWFRSGLNEYGYGILSSQNASTLVWEYFVSEDNHVFDRIVITK